MASIIDELLQSGAVPPEELAKLLREQQEVGMAGQLSGSKRIGPLGTQLRQGAEETAAGLGARSEKSSLESWKAQMAAMARQGDRDARAQEGRLNRSSREKVAGMRGQQMLDAISARNAAKAGAGTAGQTESMYEDTLAHLNDLADIASQAQGMSGMSNTGLLSATEIIPGSPARKLKEYMIPLQSNEALEKLSELRKQAAAMGQKGSGLGQVTEREISLLMGARRSLETAQGEEQLDAALKFLEKQYRSSAKNIQRELDKLRGMSDESDDGGFGAFMQSLDSEDDDAAYSQDGQ